jgi:hypothetical protein
MKQSTAILRTKEYPSDYPSDAVQILDTMSFDDGLTLVGSMSLRSQQYSGDYDGYEIVNRKGETKQCLIGLRKDFQNIIKNLRGIPNVFIGDIKAGVISDWRIINRNVYIDNDKIYNYNAVQCRKKIDELLTSKVITAGEAKEAHSLIKDKPTIPDLLVAKEKLKYHIIRWSVPEVLANTKRLRDGSAFTLEEAFNTDGISKLDVIGLVANSRFTDFSVIYQFRCNGKVLNPEPIDVRRSLEENIIAYKQDGNYFKVLKRLFALAKLLKDDKLIVELNPILNSDLGRLYHIVSDMGTLITLLDEHTKVPMNIIRFEIDQFISRLSNIYELRDYLKKDDQIVGTIKNILKMPPSRMKGALEKLHKELDLILQTNSKPIVEGIK